MFPGVVIARHQRLRVCVAVLLALLAIGWFLPAVTVYYEPMLSDYFPYTETERIEPAAILAAATLLRLALLLFRRRAADWISLVLGTLTVLWLAVYPVIWKVLQFAGGLFRYRLLPGLTAPGWGIVTLCAITLLLTGILCAGWRRNAPEDHP